MTDAPTPDNKPIGLPEETAVETAVKTHVQKMVRDLISAKKSVQWGPVILIRWDPARWVILREPSIQEAEFISTLRGEAGVYARQPIVEHFHIRGSIDLKDETKPGYLETCFQSLIQWCKTNPRELNDMIVEARTDGVSASEYMASFIKAYVNPASTIAELKQVPFSILMKEVFAAERLHPDRLDAEGQIVGGAHFFISTPEDNQKALHKAHQAKINKIIDSAVDPDPPLPDAPGPEEVARQSAQYEKDKLITIPAGVDPKLFKKPEFR